MSCGYEGTMWCRPSSRLTGDHHERSAYSLPKAGDMTAVKRGPVLRRLLKPLRIRWRRRRHRLFRALLDTVPTPIRILDIGGNQRFWEEMNFVGVGGVAITLLNTKPVKVRHSGFTFVSGDARHLPFGAEAFDVVFSNSVIEHVGDSLEQRRMAHEARRVGKRYFIQTPNRYFPIEPHFFFPFFQFMPLRLRLFLVQRLPLVYEGKIRDRTNALERIRGIRLMTARELRAAFPEAALVRERVGGFTKSFIVHHGFDDERAWP